MTPSPLDVLLAPLGVEAFFADHWERAHLHLAGDASRGHALLTEQRFVEALTAYGGVPERLVAFPEHFDAALDTRDLLRDASRLTAYLDAGHPIVWNSARGVWPTVDAFTAELADALGAHVWPNVYATGTAGTPFDAHFDAHEVFAVQCAGEKRWWISEVRVNRPLDVSAMERAIAFELRTRRDEALARTAATFVASPGDVVYLPRGLFHNASTERGRSLHVTFGVRLPTGYDALSLLSSDALSDTEQREYLPCLAGDPDGARTGEALDAMVTRLRAGLTVERVGAAMRSLREMMVARSKAPASKQR